MKQPRCPNCGKEYVWDWCEDVYRTALPPHFHCIEDEIPNPGTALVVKSEYRGLVQKPQDNWFMNDVPLESATVMRCITPKCETMLAIMMAHPDMGAIVCNIREWAEINWEFYAYGNTHELS